MERIKINKLNIYGLVGLINGIILMYIYMDENIKATDIVSKEMMVGYGVVLIILALIAPDIINQIVNVITIDKKRTII